MTTHDLWPTLIAAALRDDPGAMNELARYLRPHLLRQCQAKAVAVRWAGSTIDDAAQEAWLSVQVWLPRYRPVPGRSFLAWVNTVTTRRIADLARDAAARLETIDLGFEPSGSAAVDPARIVASRDQLQRVSATLRTLPPRRRFALVAHLNGHRDRDIARRAGSSVSAVRVGRHKALTTLRAAVLVDNAVPVEHGPRRGSRAHTSTREVSC